MIRRLLNIATALSLLICMAVVVFWLRSFSGQDLIRRIRYEPSRQVRVDESLMSSKGSIWISVDNECCSPVEFIYYMGDERLMKQGDITLPWEYRRGDFRGTYFGTPAPRGFLQTLGLFSYTYNATRPTPSGIKISLTEWGTSIQLRYWMLTILLLVLPIARAIRLARRSALHRSRITRGNCPSCGYDLRASTDRCPECGMATPVQRMSHEIA